MVTVDAPVHSRHGPEAVRVSTKFTLALGVFGVCVFGTLGIWRLRSERRELLGATERELRLFGEAVRVGIEHAVRDGQIGDIQKALDALEVVDASVDMRVFDAERQLVAESRGAQGNRHFDRLRWAGLEAAGAPAIVYDDLEDPTHAILVSSVTLALDRLGGSGTGTLLILKPLADVRTDLAGTRAELLSTVVLFALGVSAAGLLLGTFYVTRPLGALTSNMRRVRNGDFSAFVPGGGTDEIGTVAAEFNLMVRELGETRQRLLDESDARRTLEAGLQRIDKLVTVGQLSAGLAHEIGSPLQVLNGRARALAARADLPVEVRRSAAILVEQSERIAAIVDQLLGFSRRKAARLAPVDLGAAVGVILELLETDAKRRGVKLDLEVAGTLPAVLADVGQVQQMAFNLLSNALRATPAGGRVRLFLEPSVFHAAGSERPSVSIAVEDTGCGMPEDVLSRAFEPFFTTRAEDGGTGLGLAVVKAIVDEHGGTIGVTSAIGAGTRFVVQLPIAGSFAFQRSVA